MTTLDPSMSETPPELESAADSAPLADWVIRVENVRKKYCRDLRRSLWYGMKDVLGALTLRPRDLETLREFEFWAVDGVSFDLRRGDALGLLGRNGAGKSTLLKMITGQRSLSAGTVTTRGRVVALTELGLGFNMALSGRENIYVNAAVHGFTRKQIDSLVEEIINFAGIREFIDSAVQTYSSGMKARLGFSVATHLSPDILVVDEVLAVGDLEFRRKCVRHILKYVREGGSVILVAHDPYLVQSMCNRCIVLDKGCKVFEGSGIDGVNHHFQLGHSKQYSSLVERAERVLGDEVDDAVAEAAARPDANLPPITEPLLPLSDEHPVIVDQIDVLATDGGKLRTGAPARVVMRCRSQLTQTITWGFSLLSNDLQITIASCTKGLDNDSSNIEEGANTYICHLPELILQPGVYAVRGGIGDGPSLAAIATRGYQDPPFFFTVAPADVTRSANFKVLHNDLVTIKAEFLS